MPTGHHYTPVEMLAKLVSFDTTSRNSNLELIGFVEDYLAGHGIVSHRVDYQPGKTNLFATIGPLDRGGVVLSGHTDVVPVDGQDWTVEPFRLTEHDGRLYGRGTADMKGFIATALALVPEFKARKLTVPLHLALSCDEEVGCYGVRPLIEALGTVLPRPVGVIVGEPTMMKVVDAHKGITSFITEIRGLEGHSSNPALGVNAIFAAGPMLVEFERIAADLRAMTDASGRFDPPYTTLHVGVIDGGTARNIIPGHCSIHWEMRLLPDAGCGEVLARLDQVAEAIAPAMQAVSPDTGITTRQINAVPGLTPTPGSFLQTLVMKLTRANAPEAVSYATEAGLFKQAGIESLICGPGSIDQAHKADEYVEIAQMDRCTAFLRDLATHCETQAFPA